MVEKTLLLDIEDKIATITMNKPERKNALDTEMINLWVDALDAVSYTHLRAHETDS